MSKIALTFCLTDSASLTCIHCMAAKSVDTDCLYFPEFRYKRNGIKGYQIFFIRFKRFYEK